MKIDVAFLPKEIDNQDISDTVCIVLDIFRASTSIVTAMSNGCKAIVPVISIEAAKTLAEQEGPVLMAGERWAQKIAGFDFGNSPFEFSADKVKQRTIVMTTTNGTIAINAARQAYATLIGSFVNASAVCEKALQYNKDIMIVCAGTAGLFSLEDSLCAGFLITLLTQDRPAVLSDAAYGAVMMYKQAEENLFAAAIDSKNGQRLVELGREDEAEYCLRKNIAAIVPEYRDKKIVIG